MSRIESEPKHSCPDIDGLIDDLKDAIGSFENSVENIYSGRNSAMEKVRQANADLREWGKNNESIALDLESENKELQNRIDELEAENERPSFLFFVRGVF
jgi:chromosome segregation ATPase